MGPESRIAMPFISRIIHRRSDGTNYITRRGFLKFAVLTTAAAFLPGCGANTPVPTMPSATIVPLLPEQIRELSARDRLFREMDILPQGPIRRLLQDRLKPIFQEPTPPEVVRGEYHYPIHEANVFLEENNQPFTLGLFNMRQKNKTDPPEFRVNQETVVNIPITHFLTQSEKDGISNEYKKGAIVFIPVHFTPEDPIYTGIAPEIIIRRQPLSQDPVEQEVQDVFERFVWIKEASSILLSELLFEDTYKTMHRNGFETQFTVFTERGQHGRVNMVIDALGAIVSHESRLIALLDIGGYVLSYKALENDKDFQRMAPSMNQKYLQLVNRFIKPADLGNTPDEIMRNTFSLILQNPELLNFPHVGDFDEIPYLTVPGNRQQVFTLPRSASLRFELFHSLPLAA
ncbi:twin-arginine translocation signal domain-containing protein [Candidatus Gottesmanbacteria bacterium]|nr:twin-arginine translocation signal domain-containing protein [Candidatus Gottesmanbacteria bacterium]